MEIIRIVRMSFESDRVADFLAMFAERYPLIKHFEGCISLRLMQDEQHPNVYYTISEWKSAQQLEALTRYVLGNSIPACLQASFIVWVAPCTITGPMDVSRLAKMR